MLDGRQPERSYRPGGCDESSTSVFSVRGQYRFGEPFGSQSSDQVEGCGVLVPAHNPCLSEHPPVRPGSGHDLCQGHRGLARGRCAHGLAVHGHRPRCCRRSPPGQGLVELGVVDPGQDPVECPSRWDPDHRLQPKIRSTFGSKAADHSAISKLLFAPEVTARIVSEHERQRVDAAAPATRVSDPRQDRQQQVQTVVTQTFLRVRGRVLGRLKPTGLARVQEPVGRHLRESVHSCCGPVRFKRGQSARSVSICRSWVATTTAEAVAVRA